MAALAGRRNPMHWRSTPQRSRRQNVGKVSVGLLVPVTVQDQLEWINCEKALWLGRALCNT